MSDLVRRLRDLYLSHGTNYVQEAADEIERLRAEIAICRDAIETAYDVVSAMATDTDSDDAVRRCTLRRLNEAVGKATPRLMYEKSGGEKFYGLLWRELRDENERLRAEVEALQADAERYRWLRARRNSDLYEKDGYGGSDFKFTDDLDAAIDAARGAKHG